MEGISWSVHSDMESNEKSVQNVVEGAEKPVKRKRSQSEKVGRHKYTLQILNRIESKLGSLDRRLGTIERTYKASVDFDRPYIEDIACCDEVDRAILQLLFEAGGPGVLPKDLAAKLVSFNVRRFQVSRRILRMNKRLYDKLEERVAEQRGWHWALTGFVVKAWGATKKSEVEGSANGW